MLSCDESMWGFSNLMRVAMSFSWHFCPDYFPVLPCTSLYLCTLIPDWSEGRRLEGWGVSCNFSRILILSYTWCQHVLHQSSNYDSFAEITSRVVRGALIGRMRCFLQFYADSYPFNWGVNMSFTTLQIQLDFASKWSLSHTFAPNSLLENGSTCTWITLCQSVRQSHLYSIFSEPAQWVPTSKW